MKDHASDVPVSGPSDPGTQGGPFQTTHWSVVLTAGRGDSPLAWEAIEKLCRSYWPPVYAFVRRKGYDRPEAEDLTQEFFARLLERRTLSGITREGGRFRSFLLTALQHFLVNDWRRSQCLKRGGGYRFLSFEEFRVEAEGRPGPVGLTPERLYERRWALRVLEQAMERLRQEHVAAGKQALFDRLKGYLSGEKSSVPYATIAAELGLTTTAAKVAVHRLRRRYGHWVRHEVAQTVSAPEEVEEEIRHLFAVLGQ